MDWETRRLTELSDDELLEIAKAEAEDGVEGPQTKQDLEIIAILSAVNTAVTVMMYRKPSTITVTAVLPSCPLSTPP